MMSKSPTYTDGTCCTCARSLSAPIYPDSKTEKPSYPTATRLLPCCARLICSTCIASNPRFESYCPFCQVTTGPSPLPQGLRDPPEYSEKSDREAQKEDERHPPPLQEDAPPDYNSVADAGITRRADGATRGVSSPDVTHHLHASDTIASLSLAYGVPAHVLRAHNRLHAENLLAARRTISVPGSHYQGPSLSDKPVEDPEEAERKAKLRRFMVATKCHEYDVAELYLKQSGGELKSAIERWKDDEKWERENPFNKGKGKTPGRRKGLSSGLSGQI